MDHPTPPSPPPAIIKELENTADEVVPFAVEVGGGGGV
jgi:hypothetical protein